ncbi:MAG: hypothetical protein EZS28_023345, partial [Streblomastix strix]
YQQYPRRYWTPPILLPITIADGVIEGAAVYAENGDNGSLIIEDTSFTSCSYIENDGGEKYIYYPNNTMYVSNRKCGGVDTEECGDVNSTCNRFAHTDPKQSTPDRTQTNLQCGQQIIYTYISVGEMHMSQPF